MFTYEINIAFHSKALGRAVHFARVTLHRQLTENQAKADFREFCDRFKAEDGYSLTLTRHPVASCEAIAYSEGA